LNKADAYLQRFSFHKDRKDLQSSLDVYKTADQLLNAIKVQLGDLESKLFWRRYATRLYENAIEAAYLEGNVNNVFYFFEKSRAVILTDQLNEQAGISDSDALKLAALRKKILMLKRKKNDIDITSNAYANVQNDLLVNEIALNKLEIEIKKHNPLYHQRFFDSSFISLETMRRTLSENGQTLVELYNGDSATYLLVISAEKTFMGKIENNAFDSLSAAYTHYVSQAEVLNRDFNSFLNVSNQLYRLVFGNLSLPAGRIIISPGGKYFPFEALVINKRPVTYFVENYAVSYTYSAHYLLNNFETNSAFSSHTFMGIAPVEYSNGMAALSGSDQSLQRMWNYFRNAKNLVGSEASKNNFLNEYYKYKIIQLYTHATDSGSTGEPTIYFSDAPLSLSDLLYENKPATRLIVLSACETAEGKLYNGEGVFSFNRGFAALGIPSAVSNLWEVDNKATYKLTELFYKYVAKGVPLDIALQKAKKEFITSLSGEDKLPYYWAASILVGQSNKIVLQKSFPWKWVAAGGILLILGFVGWQVKRKLPSAQLGVERELLRE
jgi:CHAT domain-containing protein